MEIPLTALIFGLFGWNVYKFVQKQKAISRKNYLKNLIDEQSNSLIMHVAPYKKIKISPEEQQINEQDIDIEYLESQIDSPRESFRRTALEEVKFEKFQEQFYVEDIKAFEQQPQIAGKKKEKQTSKNTKDFSFSSQVKEKQEVKNNRKLSKIDNELCYDELESPVKNTQTLGSNRQSNRKQFQNFEEHLINFGKDADQVSQGGQQKSGEKNTPDKFSFVVNNNSILSKLNNKQQNDQNQKDEAQEQNTQEQQQVSSEKPNIFEKFIQNSQQKPEIQQGKQIGSFDEFIQPVMTKNIQPNSILFPNVQISKESQQPVQGQSISNLFSQPQQQQPTQNTQIQQTQGQQQQNVPQNVGLFQQNSTQGLFNINLTPGSGQGTGLFGNLTTNFKTQENQIQQNIAPELTQETKPESIIVGGLFGDLLKSNNQKEIKNDQNQIAQDQQKPSGTSLFGGLQQQGGLFQQNQQQNNNTQNQQNSGGLFSFNTNATQSALFGSLLNK